MSRTDMSSLSMAAASMHTRETYMEYARFLWMRSREDKSTDDGEGDRKARKARDAGSLRRMRLKFGIRSDVVMSEMSEPIDMPIAQFEFTEDAKSNMHRLVQTNNTDCALNVLQVTGVIDVWCADMMRIVMRDRVSGLVTTSTGMGVNWQVIELAYQHAFCKLFKFIQIRREDLLRAVDEMNSGRCIVVGIPGHITVIVMMKEGPFVADLHDRGYEQISSILSTPASHTLLVLRYDPDSNASTLDIGSDRCAHDRVYDAPIEPLYL